jgi:hypothetical protein
LTVSKRFEAQLNKGDTQAGGDSSPQKAKKIKKNPTQKQQRIKDPIEESFWQRRCNQVLDEMKFDIKKAL